MSIFDRSSIGGRPDRFGWPNPPAQSGVGPTDSVETPSESVADSDSKPEAEIASGSDSWSRVAERLRRGLGAEKFDRWLGSLKQIEDDGERLVIGVPNLFIQGWIERRYRDQIAACARETVGERTICLKIDGALFRDFRREESQFLDAESRPEDPGPVADAALSDPESTTSPATISGRELVVPDGEEVELRVASDEASPDFERGAGLGDTRSATLDGLKDDHTLERFVVGACNHVAFNAGMDVLRLPGKSYNPLFVYGGSGQGKTHLLQGLTRELFRRGVRRIRYVTCEGFVNRFVRALRNRTIDRFRRQFQTLEVLVMDDAHILQNKPQTQMELLHTIDAIATRGGQVILASDSRPQAIQKLQKQLRGRFVGGLVCRMDPPDYPTRLEILKREAATRGSIVPDGVFHLVAKDYYRNVRELIGALVRVLASSALLDEPLTEASAERVLSEHGASEPVVSLEGIAAIAGTRHGLTVADLRGRSRARTVSVARQEAVYLARILTEHSLAELGRFFGGRNHATINFAFRRVLERIDADDTYRRELEDLIAELRG